MNTKTKKRLLGCTMSTLVSALFFAAYAGVGELTSANAEATEDVWNNYEIVKNDAGEFMGVNIKDDTYNTLSAVIPTGSAAYPAKPAEDTDYLGYFGTITFELGEVTVGDYTGILIQFDRLNASANVNTRMFLEGDDGTVYRFSTGSSLNETFVKADGTVTTWKNANHTIALQSGMVGTLYVPFSHIVVYNTMNHPENGTTFTKLHYSLDTRSTGWYGDNRCTSFGTIAAVKADGTAERLLAASELTYSNDSTDETADVNLADMTKGTKIYAKHIITGGFNIDDGPADKIAGYIEQVESLWSFGRTSPRYTVNYVNEEGEPLLDSQYRASVYDAATKTNVYEITPPEIKGYSYDSATAPLTGTLDVTGTEITLTYKVAWTPTLTAKFVDETGARIAADRTMPSEYDFDAEEGSYTLEEPVLLGYDYVSADLPLTGTITEDTIITFIFKETENRFKNYDVVYDDNGKFVGVNILNSLSGGLIVDINGINSSLGYALTTIELGEVNPFLSTGFLIKVKRTENTGMAQVRMYLEDQNGTLYRLFTAVDDRAGAGDSVLITPDGQIGSVTNDATNWRHAFQLSTDGTIYIPWFNVSTIDNLSIPEGTVFKKLHFGRETRYETSVRKPIAIGTIATVYADDYNVIVDEVVNLANLTYTNDKGDETADVNLADYTKGKTVYMNRWLKGSHVDGDQALLEDALALVDWTRMPPQIVLKYVDEEGATIKADGLADAEYQAGGSVYDITPPTVVGYDFVSADKELSGVAENDFTIVLTYKKTVYAIVLKYVDENGETIRESRTVQAVFGEYVEVEADEIEGYTYIEATSGLKFTVTGEKIICLTYRKNEQKGCGGNLSWGRKFLAIPVLTGVVVGCLIKKKKSND
ncbi:MAG: MucBP domain-containing protein [Candidatus Borkfalkiaceae bacterium]|nr:MucBP domain-containing protein [Clostridia bacterium]MDY6222562.1 MucBP domain-containing protein [Christensenellaceae bacterium]